MYRSMLIILVLVTLSAVTLTAWINYDSAHFFGESDLSTGELLSVNWWHPMLRLLTIWLWLVSIVGWLGIGIAGLVGRMKGATAER